MVVRLSYELSKTGLKLFGDLLDRTMELDKAIEAKYGTIIEPKGKVDYSDSDFADFTSAKTHLEILREVDKSTQAPWDYGVSISHPHSLIFETLLDKGFIRKWWKVE